MVWLFPWSKKDETTVVSNTDPNNSEWQKITDPRDFPDAERLFKYGTWTTLLHLLKILYIKNLEIARKHDSEISGT
mgnify:CR=1 FL=1